MESRENSGRYAERTIITEPCNVQFRRKEKGVCQVHGRKIIIFDSGNDGLFGSMQYFNLKVVILLWIH